MVTKLIVVIHCIKFTNMESLCCSFERNLISYVNFGLLQWLSSKESSQNAEAAGGVGSIPGSGRSPGGEHGNPVQSSCLENPMDRGAWEATVMWSERAGHV